MLQPDSTQQPRKRPYIWRLRDQYLHSCQLMTYTSGQLTGARWLAIAWLGPAWLMMIGDC